MTTWIWNHLPEFARAAVKSRLARFVLDRLYESASAIVADGADLRPAFDMLYRAMSRETFVEAVAELREWIGPRRLGRDAAVLDAMQEVADAHRRMVN